MTDDDFGDQDLERQRVDVRLIILLAVLAILLGWIGLHGCD